MQAPDRAGDAATALDDVETSLYEVRKKIYMRAVSGWFARWRVALVIATQLVFYCSPGCTGTPRKAASFILFSRKF